MFDSCLIQYPELLVASYNNNEEAPHEPDGVALVWNMKYKKTTPEYTFHCQVHKRMNVRIQTHQWRLLREGRLIIMSGME